MLLGQSRSLPHLKNPAGIR